MQRNQMQKYLVLAVFAAMGVSLIGSSIARAAIVIEDGEGTTAQLDAHWSGSDNALRTVQMTDEESITIPAGSGAVKQVFEVGGPGYTSTFTRTYSSPQDWTSLQYGALAFDFYWNGYDESLAGRAAGKTQYTLRVGVVGDNDQRETNLVIDLVAEAAAGRLHAGQWNTVVLDISDLGTYPHFRDDGSTTNLINGQTIASSSLTAGSVNLTTFEDHENLWSNVTGVTFFDNHLGQGGNASASEGFYGIDNLRLVSAVPEPASAVLVIIAGCVMLGGRRRRHA